MADTAKQIEELKNEFFASDKSEKSWDLTVGIRLPALLADVKAEAKDEVLDELLEWHNKWSHTHSEHFNWYGAAKALKARNHKTDEEEA